MIYADITKKISVNHVNQLNQRSKVIPNFLGRYQNEA